MAMVAELKEVILKVEKLDEEEQKRIARLLENEINWEVTLQNSQEHLSNLAQEGLNEHETNKGDKYDKEYLKGLRDKAKKSWLGDINPDEWLKEVRGGYDQ